MVIARIGLIKSKKIIKAVATAVCDIKMPAGITPFAITLPTSDKIFLPNSAL